MHVLRPVLVFLVFVIIILIARFFYVPSDFKIHENGYMYGWYRASNIEEWKKIKVKFQGKDYCNSCHADKNQLLANSKHQIIQCENCHGPAMDHPTEPPKLSIDKSRELCLRCHTYLPYPTSNRINIKGIDPERHYPDIECSTCHNPHSPNTPN